VRGRLFAAVTTPRYDDAASNGTPPGHLGKNKAGQSHGLPGLAEVNLCD
jgi:hypothetical protein